MAVVTALQLHNVHEVRAYMRAVESDQAAFVLPDGTHVLVQRDPRLGLGLVDPAGLIAWKRLHRTDRWPLVPLTVAVQS